MDAEVRPQEISLDQLFGENEIVFKDNELFIKDDIKRQKFFNEFEKLKNHCFKKSKMLENILDNKIRVDIDLTIVKSQN